MLYPIFENVIWSGFIYHAITHKKLPSMQCYHIYSETRGVYLTKNHYDSYSLKWYRWLKFVVLAHGLKSLVMPHINILASILHIDKNVVDDIDELMLDFLWNKGHPLIAKDTLIQPMYLGGLKMVSVSDVFKTTKIMWIIRLTNSINAKWKTLSYYLMGITGKSRPKQLAPNNLHTQLAPPNEINDKYLTYVYSKIYTVSH